MTSLLAPRELVELAEVKRRLDAALPETSKFLFGIIERLGAEVMRQSSLITSAIAEGQALEAEVTRLRGELQGWINQGMSPQADSPIRTELIWLESKR